MSLKFNVISYLNKVKLCVWIRDTLILFVGCSVYKYIYKAQRERQK